MAWGRSMEVQIGTAPASKDALRISDLHISAKIERTIMFEPATAELVVYNASPATRALLDTKGLSIIVKAGYEDTGIGTLFGGSISNTIQSHVGPDWITRISAVNSRAVGEALQSQSVSVSYPRGTALSVVARELAGILGLAAIGLENVAGVTLPGNWVDTNTVRGAMRYLKQVFSANQCGFFVDSNELTCYKLGTASDFKATYLTSASGLLSVKKVTSVQQQVDVINATKTKKKPDINKLRRRIEFSCILHPQVLPNSLVYIDSPEITGTFLVEVPTYTLDNFGGDWKIDAEASAP